jgi:hypothetical protein
VTLQSLIAITQSKIGMLLNASPRR